MRRVFVKKLMISSVISDYERSAKRGASSPWLSWKNLSMCGPAQPDTTRPRDAFDEFIPLQPRVRLTNGLLWLVATAVLPWMEPTPIYLGSHCGMCKERGCIKWQLSYNSGINWPLVTNFGVCLETKPWCILHSSCVGCICTCARADVLHFPYLGNGWTDCAEIWFLVIDPLAWLWWIPWFVLPLTCWNILKNWSITWQLVVF